VAIATPPSSSVTQPVQRTSTAVTGGLTKATTPVLRSASQGLSGTSTVGGSLASVVKSAGGAIGGGAGSAGRSGTNAVGALGSAGLPPSSPDAARSLLVEAGDLGPGPGGPTGTGGALAYASGLAARAALPALLGPYAPAWTLPSGSGLGSSAYGAWSRGQVPSATSAVPAPGPIQGVAAPASAAASSSGFGLSLFLMLAGLLVLGALLVSGRLRLSSELWRPAPYALNLERPG
jgi:hypothetical protein